jgi:hypothetical protein
MSKQMYYKTAIDVSLLFLLITTILHAISGLITSLFFYSAGIISSYGLNTPWFYTSLGILIILFVLSISIKIEKNDGSLKFLITSLLLFSNGIINIASSSSRIERVLYYYSNPGSKLIDFNTVLFSEIAILLLVIQIIIGVFMGVLSYKKMLRP